MFPIGDDNEPGLGFAWVTAAIIAVNVAVFLLLQAASGENAFTYGFSAIPREVIHNVDLVDPTPIVIAGQTYLIPQAPGPSPIQLTLLTSMFMHGGWLHLGGNMLFLWVFGDNVEHRAGPIFFLLGYLLAGVVGSLAQIWASADSPIPSLGASGAISGVLGAYLVLFPTNKVRVFVFRFIVSVAAIWAIGLWIALQIFDSVAAASGPASDSGVAYMAHFGGFATGLVIGVLLRFGRPRSPQLA